MPYAVPTMWRALDEHLPHHVCGPTRNTHQECTPPTAKKTLMSVNSFTCSCADLRRCPSKQSFHRVNFALPSLWVDCLPWNEGVLCPAAE
jgi:hypothetical protein